MKRIKREGERNKNCGGRGKKKERNFGQSGGGGPAEGGPAEGGPAEGGPAERALNTPTTHTQHNTHKSETHNTKH